MSWHWKVKQGSACRSIQACLCLFLKLCVEVQSDFYVPFIGDILDANVGHSIQALPLYRSMGSISQTILMAFYLSLLLYPNVLLYSLLVSREGCLSAYSNVGFCCRL